MLRSSIVVGVLALGIAGCGGPAPTKEAVVEKETASGFQLVEMAGGYIDEAAFSPEVPKTRLTPWVEIDRKTGMAGNMGFTLLRVINDREVATRRSLRWLSVAKGHEMRITVAGQSVVLHAMEEGKRWHKNNEDSGGYRSTTYFEQVRYEISAADMTLFASGPITRIGAQGTKGGVTWPRSGLSMLPEFSTKVGTFYREQIAPRL